MAPVWPVRHRGTARHADHGTSTTAGMDPANETGRDHGMIATPRTTTVAHHELLLPLNVHHSEVTSAIAVAVEGHSRNPHSIGDVTVGAENGALVITYRSLVPSTSASASVNAGVTPAEKK